MDQAILRIELARGNAADQYAIRIEFRGPKAQASELLTKSDSSISLSVETLLQATDLAEYSRILSEAVFGKEPGSTALSTARRTAELTKAELRIRLLLSDNAPELHVVRWEVLADPSREFQSLARSERSSVARWSQPRGILESSRRHRHRLRSLALIANPRVLDGKELPLSPLDVPAFSGIVNEGLDPTRIRLLTGERASLASLETELESGCDILFLACHGAFKQDRAFLYFERANKTVEIVEASGLAARIGALRTAPPRLAVLASCESLGKGNALRREDGLFFSSLASQLAANGVAAVVGMQGQIGIKTAQSFLRKLFDVALDVNQVEAAVAVARLEVERQDDWWMPALLLSVDDGVLWTKGEATPYRNWDELLKAMRKGQCTPIIGSEVIERLSNRRISEFFSTKLRRRISRGDQGLPRVAQQLKIENHADKPGSELENFYQEVIHEGGSDGDDDLSTSLRNWARDQFPDPAFYPYRELAKLKIPAFITTNPDNLLSEALSDQGLAPQVLACPWKGRMTDVQNMPADIEYSAAAPVVYHLFGRVNDLQSVVLTEDDFFDHLIWLSLNNRLIPPSIVSRFADTSLIFLGFHLEDWEFRILLRSIGKLPGSTMLQKLTHVAVQLDPAGLTPEQQADAEQGLEDFFSRTEIRLDIYWGTAEDFLRELRRQIRPAQAREMVGQK
jgi:hypothetical protein